MPPPAERPSPPAALHTCAIKTDGTLACWGDNDDGQASPPTGTFIAVSAGDYHTCAIKTDGTLACWGWNEYGQATPPTGTFTAVSAGYYHTCAIRTNGTLACWGPTPTARPPRRRHLHRGQRRLSPHLRHQDRRHPGLLG